MEKFEAEEILRFRNEKVLQYQAGLLEIAKYEPSNLAAALAQIAEVDARVLGVERASIWLFSDDRKSIICQDMYLLTEHRHNQGTQLHAQDYPNYFKALEDSRILPADDAVTDPRTSEFAEGYLKPQGIISMMDVPIRLSGKVIGIICHEHIAEQPRHWSLEDQEFSSSIADMISLAYVAEDRRLAELALQEKTIELERSNQELERFAYVASHDLQDPLHLIIAFVDRLREGYASALDEKGQDLLKRLERSALRMRRLIDDLLQLSRVGMDSLVLQSVNLNQIAKELEKDLEHRRQETRGRFEVQKGLPEVSGDAVQIRQLLQNLMGNALKFHRPEIPPVVKFHGHTLDNGWVELTVEDNGIGFETKFINEIFKPFFRLHSHSKYEGSGIGLAVCQKIVVRHGGTIRATSQAGVGSKFIFTLPARR